MKRLFALLLCLVMALSLIPAAAAEDIEIIDVPEETAEEEPIVIAEPETATPNASVAIDAEHFPDPTFRDYVRNSYDMNDDHALSASEIAAVVSMDCRDLDINSLKGIEYFTALEKLDCSYNNLAVLDLSQNTALKELNCGANDLLSLNVSNNTALTYLDCSSNPLPSLDVSNNKALVYLSCTWMELSSLDVSNNTKLEYLAVSSNNLTSLDVSKNTKLKDLMCDENAIGTLDVSCCPELLFLITDGEKNEYGESVSYSYVYYMGEDGMRSHVLWFDKSTTLIYKPTITTQPKSQSAEEGTTAKFTVKATGATGYRWQYRTSSTGSWNNCTSATTGYNKATLQVSAAKTRNGYQYRCKVSNAAGSVTTNTVTLTVTPVSLKPTITTQPKSQTVDEGVTAKFTVFASGAETYQWYYRKSSSGDWLKTTLSGCTTATLSVLGKSTRSGWQFRCKVSNGSGYVYTNAVTLTIRQDTPTAKPVIVTQPANAFAAEDAVATFTVKATGAEAYQWYYRKSSAGDWLKTTLSGCTTDTLKVTAKATREGWQFRCKVSNSLGYVYTAAATLSLVQKPVITTQPSSKTFTAGTSVKFTVKATGGDLSYQWYYRTSSTGSWQKCTGTGATTATLTVEAKSFRSGYQYRCRVSNAAGYKYSSTVTLTVK